MTLGEKVIPRLEIDYVDEAGTQRTHVITDIDADLVFDVCSVFAKQNAHVDHAVKGWSVDPVVLDRMEKLYEKEGLIR